MSGFKVNNKCSFNHSVNFQPKLPGTIFTAATEVENVGGKALPCVCDVRFEDQVKSAVRQAVERFGGIDILINNASAISLTSVEDTDMKRYDLMQQINARGTFLVTRECLPYLKKSKHGHVLNMAPPLDMSPGAFVNRIAYTISKYGMGMCALGMSEEFKPLGIAVNALWPRFLVWTSAANFIRGPENFEYSRKPEIMADATYAILIRDPKKCTGNFFIDEEVLKEEGINDFDQYACNPQNKEKLLSLFAPTEWSKL